MADTPLETESLDPDIVAANPPPATTWRVGGLLGLGVHRARGTTKRCQAAAKWPANGARRRPTNSGLAAHLARKPSRGPGGCVLPFPNFGARPTVVDPKLHFQSGPHEEKWLEYDERGVPTKTIKKKKLTKKEKDVLETEYLDAQKRYAQYLQDMEAWEQQKLEAERALEKSDRLRWAFRQLGHKRAAIEVSEIDELLRVMGWTRLSRKELTMISRACADFAGKDGLVGLDGLRGFIRDRLAALLLEERLRKCDFDDVGPETLYSPRTWRNKLAQTSKSPKERKSRKSATESSPHSRRADTQRSQSSDSEESTRKRPSEALRSSRRGQESERRPPESPRKKSPKEKSPGRRGEDREHEDRDKKERKHSRKERG